MSQPQGNYIRQWRSLPLEKRTGSQIFASLFLSDTIATLLESPYPASPDYPQLSRYSICAGAPRVVDGVVQQWTPPIGETLSMLKTLQQRSCPDLLKAPVDLPFVGGWLGWLGYDVAWEIEQLPLINPDPLPFPVAFWYEPECFAVLDHQEQVLWLAAGEVEQLDELVDRLDAVTRSFISSLDQGGMESNSRSIIKRCNSTTKQQF